MTAKEWLNSRTQDGQELGPSGSVPRNCHEVGFNLGNDGNEAYSLARIGLATIPGDGKLLYRQTYRQSMTNDVN